MVKAKFKRFGKAIPKPQKNPKFKEGDRVCTTGRGRTVKWGKYCGKVGKTWKSSVEVFWDGLSFGDEMKNSEIKKLKK
jgi:hypothetical protein